jgi:addiction module HigA family antidote
MLPTNRIATHPGELLKRMFLDEMGITQVAFAKHTGMSLQRLNEIIRGKRGVTAETAWLLSQALGTSAEFWMNAQVAHDLTKNRPAKKVAPIKAKAA